MKHQVQASGLAKVVVVIHASYNEKWSQKLVKIDGMCAGGKTKDSRALSLLLLNILQVAIWTWSINNKRSYRTPIAKQFLKNPSLHVQVVRIIFLSHLEDNLASLLGHFSYALSSLSHVVGLANLQHKLSGKIG